MDNKGKRNVFSNGPQNTMDFRKYFNYLKVMIN